MSMIGESKIIKRRTEEDINIVAVLPHKYEQSKQNIYSTQFLLKFQKSPNAKDDLKKSKFQKFWFLKGVSAVTLKRWLNTKKINSMPLSENVGSELRLVDRIRSDAQRLISTKRLKEAETLLQKNSVVPAEYDQIPRYRAVQEVLAAASMRMHQSSLPKVRMLPNPDSPEHAFVSSQEIVSFKSFRNVDMKQLQEKLKTGKVPNLFKLMVKAVLHREVDFSLDNVGIVVRNPVTKDEYWEAVRIDTGCCLEKEAAIFTECKTSFFFDAATFNALMEWGMPMTPEQAQAVKHGLHDNHKTHFMPYHWLGMIDGGEYKDNHFPATINNEIVRNQRRQEVREAILEELLTPVEYRDALVAVTADSPEDKPTAQGLTQAFRSMHQRLRECAPAINGFPKFFAVAMKEYQESKGTTGMIANIKQNLEKYIPKGKIALTQRYSSALQGFETNLEAVAKELKLAAVKPVLSTTTSKPSYSGEQKVVVDNSEASQPAQNAVSQAKKPPENNPLRSAGAVIGKATACEFKQTAAARPSSKNSKKPNANHQTGIKPRGVILTQQELLLAEELAKKRRMRDKKVISRCTP